MPKLNFRQLCDTLELDEKYASAIAAINADIAAHPDVRGHRQIQALIKIAPGDGGKFNIDGTVTAVLAKQQTQTCAAVFEDESLILRPDLASDDDANQTTLDESLTEKVKGGRRRGSE